MEGSPVWQLDWLEFNPDVEDADGLHWIMTDIRGYFDSPAPRAQMSERVNAHGAFRGPNWRKARTISITGRCFAPDHVALRDAQARVAGICGAVDETYALTCYDESGVTTCLVRLDDDILTKPLKTYHPAFEFSIQLIAPDPRRYSNAIATSTTGLPRDGSGTGLDFAQLAELPGSGTGLYFGDGMPTSGLVFGTATLSGGVRLTNSGTAPSSPIYTLRGPLTKPVLTATQPDGVSGQMKYNAELGPQDTVVIDPVTPSVLLGGTASRRHLLNPANFASFFVPPAPSSGSASGPGVLIVGLTHEGPVTATGTLEVNYRDAWF